jgi:hypothetical protein
MVLQDLFRRLYVVVNINHDASTSVHGGDVGFLNKLSSGAFNINIGWVSL